METGKRSRSASIEKKTPERTKRVTKCKCPGEKVKKEGTSKKETTLKEKNFKPSMIPVLKCEKIDVKSIMRKQRPSVNSLKVICSCSCERKEKEIEDFDVKLKLLEEKEKSIAEYYFKIEETLRQMVCQRDRQENEPKLSTCARKMTSDPAVFSTVRAQNNALIDFENNVEQISSIWLKTSADLCKTLKNLKKNPSLDPMEFEVENVKIQLAIKQAKSLTLVKTKSVIAEAKKLYNHKELIRNQLEKLLSTENIKSEDGKRELFQGECQEKVEEPSHTVNANFEKKAADGTGDTTEGSTENEKKEEERDSKSLECTWSAEKPEPTDKTAEKRTGAPQCSCTSSGILAEEVENLAAELIKKNETITSLNNKIFELQKACNEHLLKYNQLQVKLSEFHEKIQWNQVLWKQIGKLKERIIGLQQSNKQLEANKKELEDKISRLDKELERLIKLNHLLNQRKYLLCAQGYSEKECKIRDRPQQDVEEKCVRNTEYDEDEEERILSDKQNAIKQLKSVLEAMRDQENFAQKQIAMFKSKIEDLENKS